MTLTWPFWISTFQKNKPALTAKHLYLLIFCVIALIPFEASAQQTPVFGAAVTYKENQIIQFVSQLPGQNNDYTLAKVDLNDDALDEYIVKPSRCSIKTMCPHHIVAFKNRQPILLLDIIAYKIKLSDKTTYGILDLIIYNQKHNDFLSKNFGWNPYSYRYEQKEF